MKNILVLILILVAVKRTSAQETIICGEVEYVQSTNFFGVHLTDYTLKFNNSNSIYIERNITSGKEAVERANKDEGLQFNVEVARNNLTPQFFYNNKNSFYFMEVDSDKELLVKEDAFTWKWDLKDEIKKIGKFNCQKAIIEFRGRVYTAWFTTEIPVPFGPWKFQGLSGLILEVYDNDNLFHIVAKKLKIGKQTVCDIKVDKSKFASALTIKGYLKAQKELNKEFFAKMSSRLPKGSDPIELDEDCDDCPVGIEIFKNE